MKIKRRKAENSNPVAIAEIVEFSNGNLWKTLAKANRQLVRALLIPPDSIKINELNNAAISERKARKI